MKNFFNSLYAFALMLCAFNPLRARAEHLEFLSPREKRQRITAGVERNLQRATERAFEGMENMEEYEESYEELEDLAEGLSDYEKESYEQEFYELENAVGRNAAKKKFAAKRGKRGRAWLATKSSGSLAGGKQNGATATVQVTITRLTFRIVKDLPIQMFNVIDNYADSAIIKEFLPAGVTLVSSNTDATRTNWEFVFSDGVNTDKVVISCSETAYNKLQYATNTDLFRVGKTLYKISDETQQQAFNGKFVIVSGSLFGFAKKNPLTLTNYIDPKNFRKDAVNITQAYDIDKQTGVILTVPYVAGAGVGYTFSITLGISVSVFQQWTKQSR